MQYRHVYMYLRHRVAFQRYVLYRRATCKSADELSSSNEILVKRSLSVILSQTIRKAPGTHSGTASQRRNGRFCDRRRYIFHLRFTGRGFSRFMLVSLPKSSVSVFHRPTTMTCRRPANVIHRNYI